MIVEFRKHNTIIAMIKRDMDADNIFEKHTVALDRSLFYNAARYIYLNDIFEGTEAKLVKINCMKYNIMIIIILLGATRVRTIFA